LMKPSDYPTGALARGEHGTTVLMILNVHNTAMSVILRSSGYPDLDQAAVQIAFRKSNIKPADFDGQQLNTAAVLSMVWSPKPDAPK